MGSRFSHMQQAQRAHELHSLAPLFPTDTGCSCTTQVLKMAGSGYRRFARSRLYEYILVVMRFYFCI